MWPLHGVVGSWGGVAAGIFGASALGGLGGVSFMFQFVGTLLAVIYAVSTGYDVYKVIDKISGFRLDEDQGVAGADLTVNHINAYPEKP